MNRTFLLFAVLIFFLSACSREINQSYDFVGHEISVNAVWGDEPQSKTVLQNDGHSVWWKGEEHINLFYGSEYSGEFVSESSETKATTSFSGTLKKATSSTTDEITPVLYWAVYPYNVNNSCDGTSVSIKVPDSTFAVAQSFEDNYFPAIAISETRNLSFFHVCGGARFSVTQEGGHYCCNIIQ